MLTPNPAERITLNGIMQHPWCVLHRMGRHKCVERNNDGSFLRTLVDCRLEHALQTTTLKWTWLHRQQRVASCTSTHFQRLVVLPCNRFVKDLPPGFHRMNDDLVNAQFPPEVQPVPVRICL